MPHENTLSLAKASDLIDTHTDIASWQANLQAAAVNSISEADIQAIVAKQIEKAKAGDESAAKFVIGHLLGSTRPISIKNVVHVDSVESAARLGKRLVS